MDVVHGRQVTCRGQAHLQWRQALGAKGAQARSHGFQERLQALQHVCGVVYCWRCRATTNVEQSQEQVLTVAAQVRTSVERSCMNLRDAFFDGETTLQALWDLLCYVNIVWFKVHIQTSVILAALAVLGTNMKNSIMIAC